MGSVNIAAPLVLVFLVVAPMRAYAATSFPVDWNLSSDYSSWATKNISVGDQLVFSYDLTHSVYVVSESDYTNCITSNSIFSDASGKTTYTLSTEGTVYFICGTPGHCPGMQLKVNVKAAASPSSPSPASSASPPDSTPTPTVDADSPPPSPPSPTYSNKNGGASPCLSALLFGVSLVFETLFAFHA